MDASPFSKLPRELRDIICHYALCAPEGITIDTTLSKPMLQHPQYIFAIRRTCKQIREECSGLFWSVNTVFRFSDDRMRPWQLVVGFMLWVRMIGESARRSVREVEIMHTDADYDIFMKEDPHVDRKYFRRHDDVEILERDANDHGCTARFTEIIHVNWTTDAVDVAASRVRLSARNFDGIRSTLQWRPRSTFAPSITKRIESTIANGNKVERMVLLNHYKDGNAKAPKEGIVSLADFTDLTRPKIYHGINPDAVGDPSTWRTGWMGEVTAIPTQ